MARFCGRADEFIKTKTGFNLIGLFVGSEGMLGVVTEIILRLLPLPPARATLSAAFAKMSQALRSCRKFSRPVFCRRPLEMPIASLWKQRAKKIGKAIVPPGNAHLLVDLDGQEESVRSEAEAILKLLANKKPSALEMATGEEDCEKLWALRREFSNSLRATG